MSGKRYKPETRLSHLGRDPARFDGAVNPPVYHVSTVLASDTATFQQGAKRRFEKGETVYGRFGTPTDHALQDALCELDGGADTMLLPSGLQAIVAALFTVLETGDHALIADTVYAPTRKFCDGMLARLGIEVTYYDPTLDAESLGALIRENTRALFLESPGSSTFEIQDVPSLVRMSKAHGLATLMDNTWATPLFFRPLEHGVDLSIQAGTKYIVGHADAMLGAVTANADWAHRLRATVFELGACVGPDNAYLALRGLRTMSVRLKRHQDTALRLARWLETRPEVHAVLHPALESHPQHALWRRDFEGSSGLFGVTLAEPHSEASLHAMLDGFELFGIGASWGGFESLAIPTDPRSLRSATVWQAPGPTIRLHAGLEDPDDLIGDLAAGFARLHEAAG